MKDKKIEETKVKNVEEVKTGDPVTLESDQKVSLEKVQNTEKVHVSDNEIKALTEMLKSSPKRNKKMRLSARLRLRNRNSRRRPESRRLKVTPSESSSVNEIEPEKKRKEAKIRSSLDVVPNISEINSNTIEDPKKITTTSKPKTTTRRNGRKSFLSQRARLLKLLRARVRARDNLQQTKEHQEKTTVPTEVPEVSTKRPHQISKTKIPAVHTSEKIKITPSKAIRQRLRPSIVQTPKASPPPIPTLDPVKVTQPAQFYESLREKTTEKPLDATLAPQTVSKIRAKQPVQVLKPKLLNQQKMILILLISVFLEASLLLQTTLVNHLMAPLL